MWVSDDIPLDDELRALRLPSDIHPALLTLADMPVSTLQEILSSNREGLVGVNDAYELVQADQASAFADARQLRSQVATTLHKMEQALERLYGPGTEWGDYRAAVFGDERERVEGISRLAARYARRWRPRGTRSLRAMGRRRREWDVSRHTVKRRLMEVAVVLALGEIQSDTLHRIRLARRWVKDRRMGEVADMPLGEHDYRHVRRKLRMLAIQFAEEILTEDSPMRAPSQSGEWKQIVSLDDEEGARTARSTQSPGLAYEVDADNDSPYEQLLSVTNADPLLHLLAREHQDEQHARLREVLSVLTQLPPKAQTTTRDLLRLLMLSEDFTIAEAARALGIREDHGRQLLRRFRRRVMDAVG